MNTSFCTYLTIYSGNKLPPFYIGHTSINKIENENYHGSVCSKKYKNIWELELKLNPQLFKTFILTKHNNRTEAILKEQFFQQSLNVINNSLYINLSIGRRCTRKGIPLSESTKAKIAAKAKGHKRNLGKKHTEETKQKMSQSAKGKHGHEFRGKTHTQEVKERISKANKGIKKPWLSELNKILKKKKV